MKPTQSSADPLYVIFEQHLYNFQDSDPDRKTFIENIVQDYLSYLRKMRITIPRSLEHSIVEELVTQVNTMLLKKIYGCSSIQEFKRKSRARRPRLSRVAKALKSVKGA